MGNNYKYKYPYIEELRNQSLENLKSVQRDKLDVGESFKNWKGGRFLSKIKQSGLVQTLFFYMRLDYVQHIFSKVYRSEIERALRDYLSEDEFKDESLCKKWRKDIIRCDRLIMAKPYEYFFLGLRDLPTSERKNFVTDKYMLQRMSMTGNRKLHDVELNDKYNFYLLAKPFFQRRVIKLSSDMSFEDFFNIVHSYQRLIFKPTIFGCGEGIFVADLTSNKQIQNAYTTISEYGGEWIAEELIIQCHEMAQWNASSVNTIRLLTFCDSRGGGGCTFVHLSSEPDDLDQWWIMGVPVVYLPQ